MYEKNALSNVNGQSPLNCTKKSNEEEILVFP